MVLPLWTERLHRGGRDGVQGAGGSGLLWREVGHITVRSVEASWGMYVVLDGTSGINERIDY